MSLIYKKRVFYIMMGEFALMTMWEFSGSVRTAREIVRGWGFNFPSIEGGREGELSGTELEGS